MFSPLVHADGENRAGMLRWVSMIQFYVVNVPALRLDAADDLSHLVQRMEQTGSYLGHFPEYAVQYAAKDVQPDLRK